MHEAEAQGTPTLEPYRSACRGYVICVLTVIFETSRLVFQLILIERTAAWALYGWAITCFVCWSPEDGRIIVVALGHAFLHDERIWFID